VHGASSPLRTPSSPVQPLSSDLNAVEAAGQLVFSPVRYQTDISSDICVHYQTANISIASELSGYNNAGQTSSRLPTQFHPK
jgi:hypothetical protein